MTMQLKRVMVVATALALCVAVAACETISSAYKSAIPDTAASSVPARPASIGRIQSGDKVKVVIYGEGKLSGTYPVDTAGLIHIPLLGAFEAANRTKRQLKLAISNKLRAGEILVNPVVGVSIVGLRPFYVLGEVVKPGRYEFSTGLNVMSAVAVAGGYTYRASKSYVNIQRAGEKTFTKYPLSPGVAIHPGDLISVPERYF